MRVKRSVRQRLAGTKISWALTLPLLSVLVACPAAPTPKKPVAPTPSRRTPVAPRTVAPDTGPGVDLYSAEQALSDVLSGPLQHIGTGTWPGAERYSACVFRNDRVLVVNAYCAPGETQAFRLVVFSPTRGRLRIYAEGEDAPNSEPQADYFTFMVESEPTPDELEAPALDTTFRDLRNYERRRYDLFSPACYGGRELERQRVGCLGSLQDQQAGWESDNAAFWTRRNREWNRVVELMRGLAKKHGREPKSY